MSGLGERLGFGGLIQRELTGPCGKNTRPLTGLLRQSVYGRLGGHEDLNEVARLKFPHNGG